MRQFDILFARCSVERVYTWRKGAEVVELFKQWEWYGGTLRVKDDQEFDIDSVRENKNSEWQAFQFEEGEDLINSNIRWYPDILEILESGDDFERIRRLRRIERVHTYKR